jgi:hypothetical protein
VVVAAAGYGLVQFVGGGGADDPAPPVEGSQVTAEAPSTGAESSTTGGADTSGDENAAPGGGSDSPEAETGSRTGGGQSESGTRAGGPETESRPADPPRPPPATTTTTATPAALGVDEASELLQRMEFALEPSTYAMVTDSALLVWNRDDFPDRVRAHAAFVLAQRYGDEGNADESLSWARRAAALDPANEDYALFLRLAGGMR